MQIALGGDFRIAAPETSLAIMENKWGLIPDMGGTPGLRETVSVDHAMELSMTAKEVNAKDALNMGLVTYVSEDPMEHALKLAEELKNRNPDTIAHIKKFYQKAWHKNDRFMLAKETIAQVKIFAGKNQKIAVARETKDPGREWELN
jgi:enoyl-CoA hydratase/carnithine racemase